MACFYEMSEIGLPFEEITTTTAGGVQQHFYTLRVCKACRADWMRAIADWFVKSPPVKGDGLRCESAVYIRDLGVSREATPEEVERMVKRTTN
jgi:hypothetical protein